MIVDPTQIADLLRQSRDAHADYRANVTRSTPNGIVQGDPIAARAALQRASDLRIQAAALDPDFTAPAWRQEPVTHNHDELQDFYQQQLARIDG